MKKLCYTVLLISIFLSGCSYAPVRISGVLDTKNPNYEELGYTSANAGGLHLFDIIPIRMNGRGARAYRAAVKSKNADGLINTKLQEKWYLTPIGIAHRTTISGMAVRLKSSKDTTQNNPVQSSTPKESERE